MKDRFIILPRILAIVFIAFIILFSLDVFGTGAGIFESILAFIVHSVPALILVFLLIVFWKKPLVLGIAYIVFGVVMAAQSLSSISGTLPESGQFPTPMIPATIPVIALPALVIGILFLIAYRRRKKASAKMQ